MEASPETIVADSPPKVGCDCIELTDKALASYNTRLCLTFTWDGDGKTTTRVELGTQVIEKKRGARPKNILANYCPFCGNRYEAPKVREARS